MNDTEVSIKFTNKVNNQKKLEALAESLKKINMFLNAIDKDKLGNLEGASKDIEKIAKDTNKVNEESKKASKNTSKMFDDKKVRQFTNEMQKLVTTISRFTKKSAEYLENWNLLDVAFQNNTTEAERFVNTLSEMYGLDESWGYRTVGIFKQLSNAMGLSDETGTKLSKTLSQLAIDTSSLYNIDVQDTVNILQSALAGQTKPARRLGSDITQSTLQLTLDTFGIDKAITDLTYAEKRLVIVASILTQTNEAWGDWGRTMESSANQMRIFDQQVERLTRALGNVFLPILQKILPFLNAILMVITEIINWIAILVGYNEEEFDFFAKDDSIIDFEEEIAKLGNSLGVASDNAQKLKSGLRSFDKLNNIKTPEVATSGASGGGRGSGGISSDILDLFNKTSDSYLDSLDKVSNKATKIRDTIMEWLGFTKVIDEETGKVSFKFDHITGGTVLGALAVGGIIYRGVSSLTGVFKKIATSTSDASKSSSKLNTALSGLMLMAGGSMSTKLGMQELNKDLSSAVGWMETLGGLTMSVFGGAMIGSIFGPIGTGLGALTGGVISLTQALTGLESNIAMDNLTIYTQKLTTFTDALQKQYDTISNNASQSLAMEGVHQTYINELEKLVDANGRVKEGYEGRAKFITSTLKDAYGIELKMTNGVIENYDSQITKLKELMANQKARIYQQLAEEQYVLALKNRNELESKYITMQRDLEHEKKLLADYEKKIQEARETGNFADYQDYTRLVEDQRKKVQELDKAYFDLEKQMNNQARAINNYEGLTQAMIEGNTDAYNDYFVAIEQGYNSSLSSTRSYFNDVSLAYIEYEKRVEQVGQNITDKQREQAKTRVYTLIDEITTQINKTKELSPEMIETWKELGRRSEEDFILALSKVDKDMQQEVIDKMYSQGYKFSSELQKGINAKGISVKFKADTSSIQTALNNLKLPKWVTNNSLFSSALSSLGYSFNANGGMPPVGQIFVANEKGPEFVGHLGGRTFVANQNQMMDLLDKKLGNAQSGINNATFVIQVGDEEIARKVLNNLQDMAKSNGEQITIG